MFPSLDLRERSLYHESSRELALNACPPETGRPEIRWAALRDAVWAVAPGGIATARRSSFSCPPLAALIPPPQPVPKHTLPWNGPGRETPRVVKHRAVGSICSPGSACLSGAPVCRKQRSREIVYLAERYSPQVVPGSLLLSKDPEKPIPEEHDGRFVHGRRSGNPLSRGKRRPMMNARGVAHPLGAGPLIDPRRPTDR